MQKNMDSHRFISRPSFSPRLAAGDRMHLRLRFTDGTEILFRTENADSYETLVGQVREAVGHRRGLARVSMRNASRGWAMERPIMLS